MRERKGLGTGQERGAGWLLAEAATIDRRYTDVSASCDGLLKNERGGIPKAVEMGAWPLAGLLSMSPVDS